MQPEPRLPFPAPPWVLRALARPWSHVAVGAVILGLDLATGPDLLFPILFVVPVSLAAWCSDPRLAFALAAALPVGRSLIAHFVDRPHEDAYIVANAAIRIGVLEFLAFLVARTAHLTRLLEARVAGLVTMCAWSRTIEYEGEWVSFEEYLERRFSVKVTHGISPDEARRLLEQVPGGDPPPGPPPGAGG